jgi:hypothetical protein
MMELNKRDLKLEKKTLSIPIPEIKNSLSQEIELSIDKIKLLEKKLKNLKKNKKRLKSLNGGVFVGLKRC